MTWTTQPRSKFGELAAIKAGAGPGLLLLHGVGLRAEAWGAQIPVLSRKFRVLAPDMPGHGGSAPFEGEPTLEAYTDRVAEALDGPCLVAGHSMGAMIALDLAARYPSLVQGVAALNAVYRRSPDAKRAIAERVANMDGATAADPAGPIARWFGGTKTPQSTACADWLRNADPEGYLAAYRAFAAEDGPADETLRNLQCLALFMTGAQDANSTPEMSEAMAEMAAFGASNILPDAAHMMPMTHGAEVNATIEILFKRTQSEAR